MLEEGSMEKKIPGRSVVAQKATCDIRKDNGSKFSKQGKRRDGSDSRSRQDVSNSSAKKPSPQKFRSLDKRPQTRGYFNDASRHEVTLDSRAEFGSALQQGSKKGNLNHLLNFTFAPREASNLQWKGRNNWSRSKIRYNKEQFLQATCQFVVSNKGDYSVSSVDPDRLVDWELIEKVHIFSHEVPSCPICLFHPVAAKLTRCGHIYCWSCILHYLSLGEKSWRKCPICNEAVDKSQLKSVMALPHHQFNVGEQITMKLMKRERGSTYTVPKPQWTHRQGKPHNLHDKVDVDFLKLLVATNDDVREIIEGERRALRQQLKEESEDLAASFIEHALELLKERESALNATCQVKKEVDELLQDLTISSAVEKPSLPAQLSSNKPIIEYASAFSDEEVESDNKNGDTCELELATPASLESGETTEATKEDSLSDPVKDSQLEENIACSKDKSEEDVADCDEITVDLAAEELQLSEEGRSLSTTKMTENYYFYQASDGQHVYLNSLNARCLAKEYGNLEHAPDTITATIVEMESVSMTEEVCRRLHYLSHCLSIYLQEEVRRRLRYLSHLPVTCPFMVAELSLKPPILSKEIILHFSGEIDKRRRQRQRKSRDERRRFKDFQEKENPRLKMPLQSNRHFPEYGTVVSRPSESPSTLSTPSSTSPTPIGSPLALNPSAPEFVPGPVSPVSTTSSEGSNQWGAPISFAQMLQQGKSKPDAWPKTRSANQPTTKIRVSESDASDNEDKVPVPEFHAAFGNAIQEALEKMNTSAEVVPDVSSTSQSGGRKKKGKQKKLLFSTTMNRSK